VIAVTDDVASAVAAEHRRRRGIAGGVVVFKSAGAAAGEGRDLGGVTRVEQLANDANALDRRRVQRLHIAW